MSTASNRLVVSLSILLSVATASAADSDRCDATARGGPPAVLRLPDLPERLNRRDRVQLMDEAEFDANHSGDPLLSEAWHRISSPLSSEGPLGHDPNEGFSDEAFIKKAVEQDLNLDVRDARGRTPLMHAVIAGRLRLQSALIRAGANLHYVDEAGKTASDYAQELTPFPGRRESLYYLTYFGSPHGVYIVDSVREAVIARDFNTLYIYRSTGVDFNNLNLLPSGQLMVLAIKAGDLGMMDYLFYEGERVDFLPEDPRFAPVVTTAAGLLNQAAVEKLIEQGANINEPGGGAANPSDINAVRAAIRAVVARFHSADATNAPTQLEKGLGFISWLISKGANPNANLEASASKPGSQRLLSFIEDIIRDSAAKRVVPELLKSERDLRDQILQALAKGYELRHDDPE